MIQVFNAVNLGQIFAVAVIASAIWWQSDSVSDIAGALFFISIQQAFNGLNVSARPSHPVRFPFLSLSLARALDRSLGEKSIMLRFCFRLVVARPRLPLKATARPGYRVSRLGTACPGYRISRLPHVY